MLVYCRHMKNAWFRPWGLTYWPISWQGWVVTLAADAFCLHIIWTVDRLSHSVSDTLYGIFPFIVPTFLLWNWIAAKKSA